jgi:uncharacterized membrane protein
MNKNMIGALLVSMAASSALAADTPAPSKKAKTEYVCQNNQCKGHADCMGFGNDSCKGHNECKGQGILKAKNKAECTKKTGLWVAKK